VWSATLLSAVARQWSALCTFLTLAVLARTLTSEDFGRFTFYLAWLSFLDVFADCTSTVAVHAASDPAASRRRGRPACDRAAPRRRRVASAAALRPERGPSVASPRSRRSRACRRCPPSKRDIAQSAILLRALGVSPRSSRWRAGRVGFGPYLLVHAQLASATSRIRRARAPAASRTAAPRNARAGLPLR
jgi:hypothetical protein